MPLKTQFPGRSRAESALVVILVFGVDAYKAVLSPLFAGSCRFEPSCSQFAREALNSHGAWGVRLALGRIWRCRPFGGSGFDPVPDMQRDDAAAEPKQGKKT